MSIELMNGYLYSFCIKINNFAVLKEDSEKYPLSHRSEKFASSLTTQNNLYQKRGNIMLYLNSVDNAVASKTEKKYAICYEKIPAMQNVTELAPSKELLTRWESKEIGWEEFRKNFMAEMRAEYRKEESRLKTLIQYSLENDITLHSPEPSGEQTYRAILEELINNIWQREGRIDRVINLAGEQVEPFHLTAANHEQMKQIATKCEFFSPMQRSNQFRTCQHCNHLDQQVYMCPRTNRVVIHYEWTTPVWISAQS